MCTVLVVHPANPASNCCILKNCFVSIYIHIRYRHRFFDQDGHQTKYASIGNKHFFSKTYQNEEQSQQKLGTFLGNHLDQNIRDGI